MRLLHVTDLHVNEPWFDWVLKEARHYDAVAFSGDFLSLFADLNLDYPMARQGEWVVNYLAKFPVPFFGCTGNHEWGYPFLADAAKLNPLVHGDGTDMVLGGHRFVCVPWKSQMEPLAPSPEPVILVTHVPPINQAVGMGENGDCGREDLEAVAARLPAGSVILSGHVHTPARWFSLCGLATCLNPGVNELVPVPNHVVVDYEKHTAEYMVWATPQMRKLGGIVNSDCRSLGRTHVE